MPDGSDPAHPVGSFPHIPHYAIGCTLEQIRAEGVRGRMTIEEFGRSAQGRADVAGDDQRARDVRAEEGATATGRTCGATRVEDPPGAQRDLRNAHGTVKIPLYIQSGIHGNESEGVDAMMQFINRLATTRRGDRP